MELDEYVACMYEGEAERAILDILLDNDILIFSREELLEEEPIARCKPKDFYIIYHLYVRYTQMIHVPAALERSLKNVVEKIDIV